MNYQNGFKVGEKMSDKIVDITGEKFGRWTALFLSSKDEYSSARWMCICECGTKREVYGSNLRNGKSKSCGCLAREKQSRMKNKHGLYGTKFYSKWASMISRCTNPNNRSFKDYGGRGISVCDDWMEFTNFKDDLYLSYLEHVEEFGESNTTLDRIDVNCGYELSNVRWATLSEQARNKRIPKNNSTGYPGVYFSNKTGKWEARVSINGKKFQLGTYETKNKALFIRKKVEDIIDELLKSKNDSE